MAAGDSADDPVSRLAAALRELHAAAGSPSPSELKRQGQAQRPPVSLPSSTISDWLRGNSVPSDPRAFLFLVGYLERRARRVGRASASLTTTQWEVLLERAQGYRRANQGGRPARERLADPAVRQSGIRGTDGTAYLEQVRRIAPPVLVGRDEELAELARFCLDPGGGVYAWWQAEAWAGKSALLSSFVLHPPAKVAERVRLVSFFVTGRLAAQDTREAFTQVLLEQLADVLGEALPAALPEATREAFLLDLLSRAAAACVAAGIRLVLVVDGLDEDRGTLAGPRTHSIAGLLPGSPAHGMRVVVASRSNPPLPDDVPDWHPLRDPGIVRPLSASPYAVDLQRLGNQELRRLLGGSAAEHDVLGLLTAARGGLTARDLEELSGIPLWQVEEILHSTAGRTFTRRAALSWTGTGPETYLLGHEELQAGAMAYLGERRLSAYRDRLHHWAEGYQARRWPRETPEYLLSGYFGLLDASGDLSRMVALTGETARHHRMLALTGGDAAALAEIRTALDRLAADDAPDVVGALDLAYTRDLLTARNAVIPDRLPAVWAILGQISRAEALIDSMATTSTQHAKALARLAQAFAGLGQPERAAQLALTVAIPAQQAEALTHAVVAFFRMGQRQQAAELVNQAMATVSNSDTYALFSDAPKVLLWMVETLTRAGQLEEATAVAGTISYPRDQVKGLLRIAEAFARAGQEQRATALFEQAAVAVESVHDPDWRGDSLADIAGALAGLGWFGQAEAVARSYRNPHVQAPPLMRLAEAAARAGADDKAEELAHSVVPADQRTDALALAALRMAIAGRHNRAMRVIGEAKAAALSIVGPGGQAESLARVAEALAGARQQEQAESLARSLPDPVKRADALIRVAAVLVEAGQYEQAERLALSVTNPGQDTTRKHQHDQAVARVAEALANAGAHPAARAVASSITARHQTGEVAIRVTEIQAGAGQLAEAETTARAIESRSYRAAALAVVAEALAKAGMREAASTMAGEAEAIGRSANSTGLKARFVSKIIHALAAADLPEQAVRVAHRAATATQRHSDPELEARLLSDIAWDIAVEGHPEEAARIAGQAEARAFAISRPQDKVHELTRIAQVLLRAGQLDQAIRVAWEAEAAAQAITKSAFSHLKSVMLSSIVNVLSAARQYHHAEEIARSISDPYSRIKAFAYLAEALASAGQFDRGARAVWDAEEEAHSIPGAGERVTAFVLVSRAWAGLEQQKSAVRVARDAAQAAHPITESHGRVLALTQVAHAFVDAGQRENADMSAQQARQAAESVTNPESKVDALLSVAAALVKAGNKESAVLAVADAEQVARSISDADSRSEKLARIVRVLAKAGEHERAERLACSIVTRYQFRAEALNEVVDALVAAGDFTRAEIIAHKIERDDSHVNALVTITQGFIKAGDTKSARRMAAVACTAGDWGFSAATILQLDRSAVDIIVRALSDEWHLIWLDFV